MNDENILSLPLEYKTFDFEVTGCEEIKRDGMKFGIVKGYASTYEIDQGNDRVIRGAFKASMLKSADVGKKNVPMKYSHKDLIGGFPFAEMDEDDIGLSVIGEINLEVQRGREIYALAKQGVIDSFSIGYRVKDFRMTMGVRELIEVDLREISLVDNPMNLGAVIESVKDNGCLPLSEENRFFGERDALERIREATGSKEKPSESYKQAFFWHDSDHPDDFGSYKFLFADIVDGRITAVPNGIFAAARSVEGEKLDKGAKALVENKINSYYSVMHKNKPFKQVEGDSSEKKTIITLDEVVDIVENKSRRDAEILLRQAGFSQKAATLFTSKLFVDADQSDSGIIEQTSESSSKFDLGYFEKALIELKSKG